MAYRLVLVVGFCLSAPLLTGACRSESVVTDHYGAPPPVDTETGMGSGGSDGTGGRSSMPSAGTSGGGQAGTSVPAGGQSGNAGQAGPGSAGAGAAGGAGPADASPDPDDGAGGSAGGSMGMGGTGGATMPPQNPDMGAPPPASNRVLLVTGPDMPVGTDAAIRDRLAMRFMVDVISDVASETAQAAGKALVVISGSVDSMAVGTKFRDVAVPVMLLEANLMGTMGLTGNPASQHGSTGADQTRIAIVASNHPLAAGLSGTVSVYDMPWRLAWGVPSNAAVSVATVVGTANQRVIFGYDRGAMMVSGTAAARRMVFFIRENPTNNLGPNALTLLDAAVTWLTE